MRIPVATPVSRVYHFSVNSIESFPTTSPCIKVCQLDQTQRCYGCGRTLDEIAAWSRMTPEQRQAVNARLGFRGHGENR